MMVRKWSKYLRSIEAQIVVDLYYGTCEFDLLGIIQMATPNP